MDILCCCRAVKSMTSLNKDKAPFTPQIPWQLLQASCWHLICSISFPWPNSSHAEAVEGSSRWHSEVFLHSRRETSLISSSEPARVSHRVKRDLNLVLLSVSQSVQQRVCFLVQSHGEETTRSRCGLSCVISFNLKWLGWNLSFGFEEFFLLVEPFEISVAIIRKMKNSVLHSHLESPYLPTRFWTLNQWPCHHNHTRLDLCLDSDSALAPHPPKKTTKKGKTQNWPPPSPSLSPRQWGQTYQADSVFPSMWLPGWTVPGISPPVGACRY